MLSFINSASEHAHALVYFHHYAFFFLLVVIFFVIWLLKLVLNFVVLEKNLRSKHVFSFFGFGSVGFFLPSTARLFLLFSLILTRLPSLFIATFLNIFLLLSSFRTRDMLRHGYEMHTTMYPDLGIYVNSFNYLPTLTDGGKCFDYIRPFSPHFNVFSVLKSNTLPTEIKTLSHFYLLLYDLPFLMPHDRINVKAVGSWPNAEWALILLNFNNFFYINSKHYLRFTSDSLIFTLLSKKSMLLFGLSSTDFRRRDFWYQTSYYNLPFSLSLLGHTPLFFNRRALSYSPSSIIHNFTYSNSNNVGDDIKLKQGFRLFDNLLMTNKSLSRFASFFYSTESRAFFYLFFQNVRHKKILEWIWTCVPALILILILYPSLVILYCYDRPYVTKPYLTFKAIGHQWYWSYEYSDFLEDNAEFQHVKFDSYMLHEEDLLFGRFRLLEVDRRLILPAGICLRLITTSADVLHSWAVPALGVKIDAVPGRLNQFWIVIDRPGTFYGQCSELCGVNHGFMPIVVEGVSVDTFFDYLNVVGVL